MSSKDEKQKAEPRVKTEHPSRSAAEGGSSGGDDRPGFDLGGASRDGRQGPDNTIPGGPKSSPSDAEGGRGG